MHIDLLLYTDMKLNGEGTQVTTNVSDEYTVSISKVDSLHGVITHMLPYSGLRNIKVTNKACSSVNSGQSKILIYFHKHQSRKFEQ
jgi:hypothetical protein